MGVKIYGGFRFGGLPILPTCPYSVLGTQVQIGAGTSTAFYAPIYGLFNYSWYGAIWLSSELVSSKQITGIDVQVTGYTTPYTVNNQTVKLYHVVENIFPSTTPQINLSDLTILNETVVKSNFTFTINSNGWQTITFDENFCYDSTYNLLMVWENKDGSYQTGFGSGLYDFSPAISRAAYAYGDAGYPSGTGFRTNGRINAIFKY